MPKNYKVESCRNCPFCSLNHNDDYVCDMQEGDSWSGGKLLLNRSLIDETCPLKTESILIEYDK